MATPGTSRRLGRGEMRHLGWLWLLASLGGCKGPCEQLCVNLATYAEECGFAVAETDLDACLDGQASATKEEKDVCRDYGSPDVLRTEWTCDDLEAYWSETP
jgi:hypothetical protein